MDERDVMVATVPGALELGVALSHMAETFEFDALIALGAVIRGETYHFEVVSNEMATAITRISLETGIPIANGVLTVDTDEQAQARAPGRDCAQVAVEMANLVAALEPEEEDEDDEDEDFDDEETTTSADSARANARSARRRAREFALQGVYAWLLRGARARRTPARSTPICATPRIFPRPTRNGSRPCCMACCARPRCASVSRPTSTARWPSCRPSNTASC